MSKADYKGIWVFAEQEDGVLSTTPLELLAKAHDLKKKLGGDDTVTAVLLGKDVSGLSQALIAHGAERVIVLEHDNLAGYKHRPYTEALVKLSEKYKPSIFLFAASPLGRELAPRVMAALDTGLTADAIDLDIDEDGVFVQTTPNYGGSILSHICIPERRPQMVTVHPKVFSPMEPTADAQGEIVVERMDIAADEAFVVLETVAKPSSGRSVAGAAVVVSAGRGVKSQSDLAMLEELADLLGGQLGCSRPVCDAEWLPHECQIGQSGATIKPELIVNVAISGSVQYAAGMQDSKCIMSINHADSAPIFDISHFGAVMDYSKLVPAIIAEMKSRR